MAYIPYGYQIQNGKALINIREQHKVEVLYQAFSQGATLKECLLASGIERSLCGIRAILRDRTYLGTDFYPRMLDVSLIQAVDHELEVRAASTRGHRRGRKRRQSAVVRTEFRLGTGPARRSGETAMEYASRLYGAVCDTVGPSL